METSGAEKANPLMNSQFTIHNSGSHGRGGDGDKS